MAREPDADSRPISVAELMARARELDGASSDDTTTGRRRRASAGADETAPSDTDDTDSEGSGRRRRGGAGSVSFAELTGELPKVTDTSGPRTSRRAPDSGPDVTGPAASDPTDRTSVSWLAGESHFVPDAPAPPVFPRSDVPRPTGPPDAFPRSEPPVPRMPQPSSEPWSVPGRGEHPQTRDISSGAIQDRFRASEETGVIPRIEAEDRSDSTAPHTGSLDAIDLSGLSPSEREREFERYRNFEDIDSADDEPAPEPKKRRGLFGGLRRSKATPPVDEPDPTPRPEREPEFSEAADDQRHDDAQWDQGPGWAETPWTRWPTDDAAAETDPEGRVAGRGRELHDQLRDSGDFDFARPAADIAQLDTDHPDADPPAESASDALEPEAEVRGVTDIDDAPADDSATDDTVDGTAATRALSVPGRRRRRDADAETEVVNLDRAQFAAYGAAPADDATETTIADDSAAAGTREHSPARQWAMLGLQVILGVAVGVGLFLGFTELWKWNVYFALVLAIVVIFGMVTIVHIVRRSQDLISTLLALGVGLIVTIGPLVLLASSS